MSHLNRLRRLRPNLCSRYKTIRRKFTKQWLAPTLRGTPVDGVSEEFQSELLELMSQAKGRAEAVGRIQAELNHDPQSLMGFANYSCAMAIDALAEDLNELCNTMMYLKPKPADCPLRESRAELMMVLRLYGLDR